MDKWYEERLAEGKQHEANVAERLKDLGATVYPFGIEQFDGIWKLLPRGHHPLRSLPDMLVVFNDGTPAFVEAKSSRRSGYHSVACDALEDYWRIQDAYRTRLWLVWQDMTITPTDWLHRNRVAVGGEPEYPEPPRTPFWRFPRRKVETRRIEAMQFQSANYNHVSSDTDALART